MGTCLRQLPDDRNLLGWSIFPVLDGSTGGTQHVVGYTARNPQWMDGGRYPKWLHALKKTCFLFNRPNAVLWGGTLIICEGPGDVLRWWEAGYKRAVDTFGASMSDEQFGLLIGPIDISTKVYIAADADKAGQVFAESVLAKIQGFSHAKPEIIYPIAAVKDFGDMTTEQIRSMGL